MNNSSYLLNQSEHSEHFSYTIYDIVYNLICVQSYVFMSTYFISKFGVKESANGFPASVRQLLKFMVRAGSIAIVEEILFRFNLRYFLMWSFNFNDIQCHYITSIIFGLYHSLNFLTFNNISFVLNQILFTIPVGYLCYHGLFLSETYPMLYPMLIHICFNVTQLIIMFYVMNNVQSFKNIVKNEDDDDKNKNKNENWDAIFSGTKSIRKRRYSITDLENNRHFPSQNKYIRVKIRPDHKYMYNAKFDEYIFSSSFINNK